VSAERPDWPNGSKGVDVRIVQAVVAAVAAALLLAGCAELKERRQELRDIEREADEADRALASIATEEALLAIARARDARRDADVLLELTRHGDPVVRAEALRAVGLVGAAASRDGLQDGLDDRDPAVRAMAAFALSQLWAWRMTPLEQTTAMAQAEEALLAALEAETDGGDRVAAAAMVRGLGELGGEASEELLWSLLDREELASDVLITLALRARRGATPALSADRLQQLAALVPADEPPRWQLSYLLSRASLEPEAVQPAGRLLRRWLELPADDDARVWLIRAAGKAPSPEVLESLADALAGGTIRDRTNVLRAAAGAGPTGTSLLIAGLQDPDPIVAAEAAQSLARTPTDEAWAALEGWLSDEQRAAGALAAARLDGMTGFLGSVEEPGPHAEAAVAQAVAALESADGTVRASAWGLLAGDPAQGAAERLIERFGDEADPLARLALAAGIAGRPDDIVEGTLLEWLAGPDPQLGALAADGLAEREGGHVTERLATAYADAHPGDEDADPEWERRLSIVQALVPREGVHPDWMVAMLRDPEAHVRMAAFDALVERVGRERAEAGAALQERPYADLEDPWWGVSDALQATITTSRGVIEVVLLPDVAPGAVANFVGLAEQGYFDGQLFHRVVADFVIQGGDPSGTGWGGPGWTIRDEFSPTPFVRGTLGMARSGKDTGGSQWFITHAAHPHLDGHYTVFGQMISGWDVLDAVRQQDRIESVTIRRRQQEGAAP
jgi:cyclophilin family peptidyl-prolyl cis-trans isomerase/HEAT repeat protein